MGTLHVSKVTPRVLEARTKKAIIRFTQLEKALQIVFRHELAELREIPRLHWLKQLELYNGGLPLSDYRYDGRFVEAVRRVTSFPMGH